MQIKDIRFLTVIHVSTQHWFGDEENVKRCKDKHLFCNTLQQKLKEENFPKQLFMNTITSFV